MAYDDLNYFKSTPQERRSLMDSAVVGYIVTYAHKYTQSIKVYLDT